MALPPPQLSVVEERLPEGKVRLSVTVPESWCRQAYRDTVESYRERVAIDGYRKGKVRLRVLRVEGTAGGHRKGKVRLRVQRVEDTAGGHRG